MVGCWCGLGRALGTKLAHKKTDPEKLQATPQQQHSRVANAHDISAPLGSQKQGAVQRLSDVRWALPVAIQGETSTRGVVRADPFATRSHPHAVAFTSTAALWPEHPWPGPWHGVLRTTFASYFFTTSSMHASIVLSQLRPAPAVCEANGSPTLHDHTGGPHAAAAALAYYKCPSRGRSEAPRQRLHWQRDKGPRGGLPVAGVCHWQWRQAIKACTGMIHSALLRSLIYMEPVTITGNLKDSEAT